MPSRASSEIEEITGWIRQAAESATSTIAGVNPPSSHLADDASAQAAFNFRPAREALKRARTKTDVKAPQPFRRLRRNQAAVNESLIDACSALIAVNKRMAAEIEALASDLASLRRHLARREATWERLAQLAAEAQKTTR